MAVKRRAAETNVELSVAGAEESAELPVIHVEHVRAEGSPRHREVSCACGGTLRYTRRALGASWNGQRLEVGSVWAYRCSEPDCTVTLLLPEVSEELERKIGALGAKNQAASS